MIESRVGGQTSLENTIDKAVIDIESDAETAPLPSGITLGHEGKPVCVRSQIANQVEILLKVIEMITGGISRRTIEHLARCFREVIPDASPREALDPSICQDDVAKPSVKSEGIREARARALWISTAITPRLSMRQRWFSHGQSPALHNSRRACWWC